VLVAAAVPVRTAAPLVDVQGTARIAGAASGEVVVWLEAPSADPDAQTLVLDQRNMTFEPRVLVAPVGSTVEFPNNDRVLHNVFSFHDGERFDLGLYPVGDVRRRVVDVPGISRVFCNIHPNMAAYIVAVDSPYYAVSGQDGTFLIRGVPPGLYTYHAWRAGETAISDEVTIEAGTRLEVRWP
jgi:plastocyanin